MNILIDKKTNQVEGLNKAPNVFQISIEVPDDFDISKSIEVQEGMAQKIDDQGQLLFKDNVKIIDDVETFDEVHHPEGRKPIKFKTVPHQYKTTDESGNEDIIDASEKVATEWELLDPVMIPNMVSKTVTFRENMRLFTLDEVQAEAERRKPDMLRTLRAEEFMLIDKYQLTLVYESLTAEQKLELSDYRSLWLDITDHQTIPDRPEWLV